MPDVDKQSPAGAYDPSAHRMLSFHDAVAKFRERLDTPRAYLERCIERIEALDGDRDGVRVPQFGPGAPGRRRIPARATRRARPLGAVDGMPVGIKT